MKKEIEKNGFLTAEEIMASLMLEFETFIASLPLTEKRLTLESDLGKVTSLLDIQRGQITEFQQSMAAVQLQIKTASPEDLPGLSKVKAKITADKAESEILLNELEARKADIEAALKEITDAIQPDIQVFLQRKRIAFEKEITFLVQNEIEPRLAAWDKFAPINHCFLDIKLHSPLVTEAVKNVMTPIRYD